MFENAKWIRYPCADADIAAKYNPVPYIAKSFFVKGQVSRAVLNVCGLGQAAYFLNGVPLPDSYRPTIPCTPINMVVYNTFDLTRLLRAGSNRLGMMLSFDRVYCDPRKWVPTAIVQLDISYADGTRETVVSDGSFRAHHSHVVFSMWECGEIHDSNRQIPDWCAPDYDDITWAPVSQSDTIQLDPEEADAMNRIFGIDNPNHDYVTPNFRTSDCPPIRKISEKGCVQIGEGLFDFQTTTSGYIRVKATGKKGAWIKLAYAERLTKDKKHVQTRAFRRSQKPCPEMYNADGYILNGTKDQVFDQLFSVHGFRYVEVTGEYDSISLTAVTCHTDMKRVSFFRCDNEMLNKIHDACANSIATCTQTYFVDNPKRDVPWVGDQMLAAESTVMLFDSYDTHYENMLMCKETIAPDGLLSYFAPSLRPFVYDGIFKGPDWTGAVVFQVPYYVYKYTENPKIVEDMWETMEKSLGFFSRLGEENEFLPNQLGTGDWSPVKEGCPLEVCMTAWYEICVSNMIALGACIGKETGKYKILADNIKKAYRDKYVIDGVIQGSHPTEFLLPAYAGLLSTEEEALAAKTAVEMIRADKMAFTFGVHGLRAVFDVLSRNGYADVIYDVLVNEQELGYAYTIAQGYDTVPERFDYDKDLDWEEDVGGFSMNHFFFSMVAAWFYKWVAGIKVKGFGYHNVEISPEHLTSIREFDASLHGIHVTLKEGKLTVDSPFPFTLKLNGQEKTCERGCHTFPFS